MVAFASIRAVTFDVGGTLIEPWPSVGHVYGEVASALGHGSFAAEELNRRFARAWKSKGSFDYSRAAWSDLVAQTFAGLVAAPAFPPLFEALYDRFREPSAWRVHDDVSSTLASLRSSGHKLGIISNWDERLRPLLQELGLSDCFEAIVVSHDVRATKPDVRLFGEAAAQLNLPPSAILHVGDSQREDYEGARGAGFGAILLDRGGKRGEGRIGDLTELLSLGES